MTHPPRGVIPSLDGLRAIAVLLVILTHAGHTAGFPAGVQPEALGALGTLGVRIFFILSGFLITHLLLREESRAGMVSLARFYLRRVLRIFPAFYVYLLAMVVVGWLSGAALPLDDLLSAATYTINYDRARVWVLGHAWSLGVEEQFYLLWPVAFTLLAMRGRVRWVVAVLVLGPISRLVTWRFFPSWQLMIGETFPTIADALASGVLLAIMRDRWHAMPSYRRLLRSGMLGLLPLGILLLNKLNAEVTVFGWLLGETMINFAIVLVIDRVSSFPDTLSARFLNLPPMVFLGHLSYSLYLWQQPFLPAAPAWVGQTFPVNIGLLFLAALASFYLIEQPFLRLKARVGGSVGRGARG